MPFSAEELVDLFTAIQSKRVVAAPAPSNLDPLEYKLCVKILNTTSPEIIDALVDRSSQDPDGCLNKFMQLSTGSLGTTEQEWKELNSVRVQIESEFVEDPECVKEQIHTLLGSVLWLAGCYDWALPFAYQGQNIDELTMPAIDIYARYPLR